MSQLELKPSNHYVSNPDFLEAIKVYKKECAEAEAVGLPRPKIPEYIGDCILKIATKFSYSASYKKNFINYPFREDMVMDAVETCVRYFHNFNPEKYSNPHSYFTQICYYSFLNRIQKEKKYLYTRFKAIQNQRELGIMADSQEHEELAEFGVSIQDNNEYMNDYIKAYEENTNKKKDKKKKVEGTLDVIDIQDDLDENDFGEMPDPDIDE